MGIYLDIETEWDGTLTVVGFYHESTGLVQLVGEEITKRRLLKNLPPATYIFTYNGHCFDLRHINNQLGVDMRNMFNSYDLRWICQGHGITGGLKGVEKQLGITRNRPDIDGLEAIRLWNRFMRGNQEALRILLEYNGEDVMNLIKVRKHLEKRKLLRVD